MPISALKSIRISKAVHQWLPGATVVKNTPAKAEDSKSLSQEDPLDRKWQPTPVFLLGKSYTQRSLAGYSSWSHKESYMTEHALPQCGIPVHLILTVPQSLCRSEFSYNATVTAISSCQKFAQDIFCTFCTYLAVDWIHTVLGLASDDAFLFEYTEKIFEEGLSLLR